eukprot:444992-Prymnesium_polylepis.1
MRAERRNGAASGGTHATRRGGRCLVAVARWHRAWMAAAARARGGVVCLPRRHGSAVWLRVAAQ